MYDTTNLEYSVVGALCIEPGIAKKLFGKVLPDDFTVDACAAVVEAAFEADVRGKAFDYVLAAEAARPLLSTTDPQRFIVECMELTPTIANAELHAELIHKAAKRRKFPLLQFLRAKMKLSLWTNPLQPLTPLPSIKCMKVCSRRVRVRRLFSFPTDFPPRLMPTESICSSMDK